jgi:hypothetical protein
MSYEDPMDVLTRYGLDALEKGDKETANLAFAKRDEIANAEDDGHSLTDLKDGVFQTEGGPALYANLGANADQKLRAGAALIAEDEELLAEFEQDDYEEKLDTLMDAVEVAQKIGYRPDSDTFPARPVARDPSPMTRQDALDAIEEILEKHPVGTSSWSAHKVQNRISYLYGLAYGEGPIVGSHLRTI